MKTMLLILLENEPGALSRVVGLFSQRGYNIDNLSVCPTEDTSISTVTIQTSGDQKIIEKIEKQLHKLINILKIQIIHHQQYIEKELALIKIQASKYEIQNIKKILEKFHSQIIKEFCPIYTIQILENNTQINNFLNIIKKHSKIINISRSGTIII
ncbi:acetolactate synthase small subunit [Buchnera aphidicola]|uniref:acetolactate synthase small subunit n=1 Tax=Buchnera aphidicola TaxID=9 RepID=UPI0034647030